MRFAVLMAAWVFTQSAFAAEPASFTADSLAKIEARYAGKPFILSLWSVNWCGHCITELTMLGKLAKTKAPLPLVLVATDGMEFSAPIQKTLHRLGLAQMESWVFNDDIPERLRQTIDPNWHGEIPRTYLYDAQHRREAVAGVLGEQKLKAWLKKNQ
jgi:thiol-disulfide isomerase/thioredoxin